MISETIFWARESVFEWYLTNPEVIIKLPMPISVNEAFANVRKKAEVEPAFLVASLRQELRKKKNNRGRVKTESYRAWESKAQACLWEQKRKQVKGKVTVVFHISPPSNHIRDAANYEKVLGDFLVNMGIIEDDSKITSNTQRWLPNSKEGYVICEIFKV